MNKVLLWLDDIRDPFSDNIWLQQYVPEFLNSGEVIWVKSYIDFEMWIYYNGLPSHISFDHDLADEHYCPQHKWNDYDDWVKNHNFNEKTGMDCAKFVVDYCLDYRKRLPICTVHSANPVGAQNIKSLLTNFTKHQEKFFEEDDTIFKK